MDDRLFNEYTVNSYDNKKTKEVH